MAWFNKQKPIFRWATNDDIERIANLESLIFKEQDENAGDKDCIRAFLEIESHAIIVVELKGQMIAFCPYRLKDTRILIFTFGVHPEHRMKEIATQILKMLTTRSSRINNSVIKIAVEEENLPAQKTLRKAGFKCTKILKMKNESHYVFEYKHRIIKNDH